jgi:muramoyltetrapeptide carboxypeptidase
MIADNTNSKSEIRDKFEFSKFKMTSVREIKLLIPARIKPGGTVGIVAPASPFDPDLFKQGIDTLKRFGFRVHVPNDLIQENGYLAGSDAHRASIVHRLFADENIEAIICAKGGFGSIRILSLLDFDLIKANPKIFLGHSDVTALIAAMYSRCGLVTFHGPLITTLADAPSATKAALLAALSTDQSIQMSSQHAVTLHSGSAQGPVIGGNLTTLCHLTGTPFEPDLDGHIVFLEDRGEAGYRIDRMLSQMKLAGCFENLAGLILGDFKDCAPIEEIYRIMIEFFQDADIPIVAGFEFGHGQQNMTIPLGLNASLDADKKILSFHQAATRG